VEQFIETPMKYYSSGMFVRLGFSVAIHTDPEILLVDEVLAVGDEQFQAKCLNVIRTMQNEGRTIVLVTHSMDSVMQFCDQAMLLHHGQVRAQGAPAEVIAAFRAVNAEANHRPATQGTVEALSTPTPAVVPKVVAVVGGTASGRPISQARTGDTLIIDATFDCPPGSAFVGRIELFHGGQLMVGTSTQRLGLDPIRCDGQVTYRFTLVEVPLAGGRYRVAVSTGVDSVDRPQHTLPAALEFSVPFDPVTVGPVAVKAEVELLG
jgi:ABC-2 type transport system ATP-binding protein